jgi:TonB family protein
MQPTAHSLLLSKPTPIAPFLVGSVALHVGVVVVAVLYGSFSRAPMIKLDQEPIKASLVRLGTPRDQKLLPRKEQELPAPPREVKAAPTPVERAPEKPVDAVPIPGLAKPEPAKQQQDGTRTGEEKRNALFSAFGKASTKADDLEGALDGDPFGDSARQEGERYYGAVTSQVRRYYDVSQTISEQERMFLKAEVFFRVSRSGEVVEVKLSKRSGNELFDSAVLAAVRRAAPFAPPPDHLRKVLETEGFILEFKAL